MAANRRLFSIKQVFKQGMEVGAIKYNPVVDIHYLSERAHERNRYLFPVELGRLLVASNQLRTKYFLPALIYLGAEHGASRQEALSLRWVDVDFEFGGKGRVHFFRTKNAHERTEFLMPRTKKALMTWRDHQAWMRKRKKVKDKGPGLIFSTLDGRPLKRFDRSWRKVCSLAGIEDFHFHDLRHTYCSSLILSGSDLKDIKEMIGHSDLSMTDRYTHLTGIRKLARQEDLARYYGGGEPDAG